jgi:hypothetical protein
MIPVGSQNVGADEKNGRFAGYVALMVLKTLGVIRPLHGYRIARRIEQISQDLLGSEQGHSRFGVAEAGATRRGCIGTGRIGE